MAWRGGGDIDRASAVTIAALARRLGCSTEDQLERAE